MNKLYNEQDIQNIATAIRTKNSSAPAAMKVREMDQAILDIPGFDVRPPDPEQPWTRPEEWPDLDALWEYDPDDKGTAWMTYIKTDDEYWGWGLFVARAQIDVGYLNENGVFVITETQTRTATTGANLVGTFPDDKDIMLIRVTSTDTTGISYFAFCTIPTSTTGLSYETRAYSICCYEIVGCLPYMTPSYQVGTRVLVTEYMQHYALAFGVTRAVTGNGIANLFYYGINLRKIDFDNFNTSDWTITSLGSLFYNCYKLQKLDFTGIDTSNWTITNMQNVFARCYALQEIVFADVDTTKWYQTATRKDSCYYACTSLETLDLSFRNLEGSNISTINSEFSYCSSLKKIILGDIDTSGWALDYSNNAVSSVFTYCYSLEELDLSKVDLSGMSKTLAYQFSSVFGYCLNLRSIVFGNNMVCSDLKISALDSVFNYCISLEEVNFEQLGEIHCQGSSTSGWLGTLFNSSYRLKEIKFPKIYIETASSGRLGSYIFRYGFMLEKLDLSDVDNELCLDFRSDCVPSIVNSRLKEFRFPKYVGTNSGGTWFSSMYQLEEIYPPENGFADVNIVFISTGTENYPNMLSAASVHRIIQALPQATGTKTCTIGPAKRKLTAEDIAIAVEKGWTIA